MKKRVGIIGGGASGLIASIVAARNGAEVVIYEKLNRVGKKILATGNGRCNYTNVTTTTKDYHGKNLEIVNSVLNIFGVNEVLEFFQDLGIYPKIENNGKVYPYSLQASSILDVLRQEINYLGVVEMVDTKVKLLRKNQGIFDIVTEDKIYNADSVIICTGGMAGSQYGCNGDGYKLASNFGHRLSDIYPAIVQLKVESQYLKRISGVKFDGKVSSYVGDELIREEVGEILFTEYGISGPPVMQISRKVIEKVNAKKLVYVKLDMFSEIGKSQLYGLLKERFSRCNGKNIEEAFVGLINKKLISVVLLSSLGENYKSILVEKIEKSHILKIIEVLKEWKFKVIGSNGWQQAQSTAGGILALDINFESLESKLVKNLYFAGEVIDIDGDCGGFNLQWAWSSGYIAGYNSSIS